MPTPYVKKIAMDKDKPVKEIEKIWHEAKTAAEKEGHAENYAYVTAIFNSMVKKL